MRLAAEEAGEGTPVVLLHGLTATRRYVVMGSKWLERNGHRVVAYDARGHGASPPGEIYTYEALADDLGEVLDAHGMQRATLAGASMGAHTALAFALAHPERVDALVLATPGYRPGEDPGLERWDALAAGLRESGVDGFVEAYGEPRVPERMRETVLTVLRQRLGRHEHPGAVADAIEQVPRSQPFADIGELERIEVPTVIVASRDETDPEHPLAVAEAYVDAIPGAKLMVEDEGASPLAWQGAQLSRVIASAAQSR